MNDEKWFDLIDEIKENFKIIDHHKENFEIKDDFGVRGYGVREVVVFLRNGQKMKIEREKRPIILDKKIHYVKTKGTGGMIELVLSQDETISKVHLYIFDEINKNWKELDLLNIF